MFLRSLISLLLIASFAIATAGRSAVRQEDTPEQTQEVTLTPDEEREARALAKEFIERFEKEEDVTSLIKDLYVSDFTERLRNHMDSNFPLAASPEVAAQMSSDEILRAYAASINCIYLATRLFIEYERKQEQERVKRGETKNQDEAPEPMISELIPRSIVELIQSDPLLAAMLEQALKVEKKERKSELSESDAQGSSSSEPDSDLDSRFVDPFEDIWPFKSLDQMRHYTSLAEQAVKLLREHFNSLPPELKPPVKVYMSSLKNESADEEASETEDNIYLRPYVLNGELMGYSPGTLIICASPLIFHIDMVRTANGQLKIINAYVVVGD